MVIMISLPRSKRQIAGWIGAWGCLALIPLCQQLVVLFPTTFDYRHQNLALSTLATSSSSSSRRNQQQDEEFYGTHELPAEPSETISIAVATTITGCAPNFPMDGAAVLAYSILNATSSASRYRYHFYAIYHPNARDCARPLGGLGYTLLEREGPVRLSEIQNPRFRKVLPKTGCCGEKELLKFEAFCLTQHAAVVLVDMDVLVLKPLDDLLDLLLSNRRPPDASRQLMWPQREIPSDIWLLYTNDYAMVWPHTNPKPTQGGFTVFKPSQSIYDDVASIVREGAFDPDLGWGNRTGLFWGSTTFQGLMPYYFQILVPERLGREVAVELHWCVHNQMLSPNGVRDHDMCYSGQPVKACDDCTRMELDDVYTAHFTSVCGKPWECWNPDSASHRLCNELHRAWFRSRSQIDLLWGRTGRGSATRRRKQFFGYCDGFHFKGYERIAQPYGSLLGASTVSEV